jgi:hypothetical protein
LCKDKNKRQKRCQKSTEHISDEQDHHIEQQSLFEGLDQPDRQSDLSKAAGSNSLGTLLSSDGDGSHETLLMCDGSHTLDTLPSGGGSETVDTLHISGGSGCLTTGLADLGIKQAGTLLMGDGWGSTGHLQMASETAPEDRPQKRSRTSQRQRRMKKKNWLAKGSHL